MKIVEHNSHGATLHLDQRELLMVMALVRNFGKQMVQKVGLNRFSRVNRVISNLVKFDICFYGMLEFIFRRMME